MKKSIYILLCCVTSLHAANGLLHKRTVNHLQSRDARQLLKDTKKLLEEIGAEKITGALKIVKGLPSLLDFLEVDTIQKALKVLPSQITQEEIDQLLKFIGTQSIENALEKVEGLSSFLDWLDAFSFQEVRTKVVDMIQEREQLRSKIEEQKEEYAELQEEYEELKEKCKEVHNEIQKIGVKIALYDK